MEAVVAAAEARLSFTNAGARRRPARFDRKARTILEVNIVTVKVAINGFGRIGRNVLRAIVRSGRTDIKVVAINDLGPVETNAHLLRYDSIRGRFPAEVKVEGDSLIVNRSLRIKRLAALALQRLWTRTSTTKPS